MILGFENPSMCDLKLGKLLQLYELIHYDIIPSHIMDKINILTMRYDSLKKSLSKSLD